MVAIEYSEHVVPPGSIVVHDKFCEHCGRMMFVPNHQKYCRPCGARFLLPLDFEDYITGLPNGVTVRLPSYWV